jgi:hypothetical protein
LVKRYGRVIKRHMLDVANQQYLILTSKQSAQLANEFNKKIQNVAKLPTTDQDILFADYDAVHVSYLQHGVWQVMALFFCTFNKVPAELDNILVFRRRCIARLNKLQTSDPSATIFAATVSKKYHQLQESGASDEELMASMDALVRGALVPRPFRQADVETIQMLGQMALELAKYTGKQMKTAIATSKVPVMKTVATFGHVTLQFYLEAIQCFYLAHGLAECELMHVRAATTYDSLVMAHMNASEFLAFNKTQLGKYVLEFWRDYQRLFAFKRFVDKKKQGMRICLEMYQATKEKIQHSNQHYAGKSQLNHAKLLKDVTTMEEFIHTGKYYGTLTYDEKHTIWKALAPELGTVGAFGRWFNCPNGHPVRSYVCLLICV